MLKPDNKFLDTLIIGGGQAGLAMSYYLTQKNIRHLVVEGGQIAQRWRSESWDSLRLLTPNNQANLPAWSYHGNDPDGYMKVSEYISYLEKYAQSFDSPILTGVPVDSVSKENGKFYIQAGTQGWVTNTLVIATGHCNTPIIPDSSKNVNQEITQFSAGQYTNPNQIPPGGILVVGAGASGVQIAEELNIAGRSVTLSIGRHRRLPRQYRGRDILWWVKEMGIFDELTDPGSNRDIPAPQLIGSEDCRSLDLGILQNRGVKLTGRISSIEDFLVCFEKNLPASVNQADQDMYVLLERIDNYANANNYNGELTKIEPILLHPSPSNIDLQTAGIKNIIWATGYRRTYPWLNLNVLDAQGEIQHSGGVTTAPGLFVIGMRRQIRYNSNFIDGVGKDAALLADHVNNYLVT
ncbi:NAD(P)-binding domain-containing protein [Pedobacter sp. PAMC26386]|nr:NAD(P)-binding domain-containing protein [Pedobacter sp. PAMC26386]